MKTYKKKLITSISILFIFSLFSRVYAHHDSYENQVLYISSYNPNFITFNDQVSGIKEVLNDNVYLDIEYMDCLNVPKENQDEFYQIIKYKLKNNQDIKAIILGDDTALEFGIKYKDDLFKDLPIVFIGVQEDENIKIAKELENVYGVIEKPSIEKNVEMISKLHSGKTVVALIDKFTNQSKALEEFYSLQSKYTNLQFKHISSQEYNYYDFKEKISELDDSDVILDLSLYKNKERNYLGLVESAEMIMENTNNPTYGIFDYSVKCGYIGGRVISHYEKGKKVGEMVNSILDDKEPSQKIVDSEDVNINIFNSGQLKKYKINKNDLPEDSIIINSVMNTISKHKNFIFTIIVLSVSLVLVIVAFILYSRKKLHYEKVLIEAKEIAESSNNAKNHLISNISHELRTPITVIMSSNQLLQKNLEDDILYSNRKNLNIIKQNCYRLLKLTNNIIDIAKVEADCIELKPSMVNIVSFIEKIVESVVPYASIKDINIIFDTDNEDIIMSVDLDKIERILLNLISNAIKFSNENSNIYINIKKLEQKIIISVKDEGVGIEPKNLSKIFDKFTQIDETMIRKNEGSGIGLSIVKSFVELHEGKIDVTSSINNGSEFIIELPIKISDNYYEYDRDLYSSTFESTNVELSDIYF